MEKKNSGIPVFAVPVFPEKYWKMDSNRDFLEHGCKDFASIGNSDWENDTVSNASDLCSGKLRISSDGSILDDPELDFGIGRNKYLPILTS